MQAPLHIPAPILVTTTLPSRLQDQLPTRRIGTRGAVPRSQRLVRTLVLLCQQRLQLLYDVVAPYCGRWVGRQGAVQAGGGGAHVHAVGAVQVAQLHAHRLQAALGCGRWKGGERRVRFTACMLHVPAWG